MVSTLATSTGGQAIRRDLPRRSGFDRLDLAFDTLPYGPIIGPVTNSPSANASSANASSDMSYNIAPPAEQADLVVFDADDTLWRSEDYFRELAALFASVVEPYAASGIDVDAVLHTTEIGNVALTGYGVAAYTLSMVQAAVGATDGKIPATELTRLIEAGYAVLDHPVELLHGVETTLDQIAKSHPLAVITKGDLLHQRRKLDRSGLASRFSRSRVVREKDRATYAAVFAEWGVDPARVLMVGNSVRSDVLPILQLGGHAVHIPYHVTWAHEVAHDSEHETEHGERYAELASISELDEWFRTPRSG